ncbi:KdsC family phosphatase [Thermocrinis minervae]|uniref:3-deoxy-D-manno-octulosonate 8-phosphate phosphatase KdsC n=1 Tax=Thermocrinis minervae TaxID=381751 RepID=A0A1M6T3C8_9AQUI|nr:HAD hydrolase family protein [Thermocrinis minervae]SHK51482.1 3-deoxy-D-manno-octulosonate 8-phosphate phosphatase (KDO 8-P phosphatase) [Thermocrinis minervae]
MVDLSYRAKKIKLFLMDVDGVLTDGKLYYTKDGEEIKVFHVKDGLAIKLLQKVGILTGVISGRRSGALLRRLEELSVDEVHLGVFDKLPVLEGILQRKGLTLEEVAYIGDDYVDIPILRLVGFPMAVADAPDAVKKLCLYTTKSKGGEGAVREAVEFLLELRGQLDSIMQAW